MIGTIRKHQQWLWILVIGATIFSFVAYFNPSSRYTNKSSGGSLVYSAGSVFGEPITADQLAAAQREAAIFYRFRANEWPPASAKDQIDEIAREFILIDAELRHNHIDVTPEAAARFTKQIFGDTNNAPLTSEQLGQILTRVFNGAGGEITAADFQRFVYLSAGQQYLISIFGMPGQLITPKEAESFYRRENEPMIAEMVSFPASDYIGSITISSNALADFYSLRQAQYRVPEKIELNYVAFPASNYFAAADKELTKQIGTNIDERIKEQYAQRDPSEFKDDTTRTNLSPVAAQAKMKSILRLNAALAEARKDAIAFSSALLEGHDEQHPFTPEDIQKVAKARKIHVQATAPFDARTGPAGFSLSARDLHMVFNLSDNDPEDKDKSRLFIASPMITENGVYVVGLKARLPSHAVPLSEIHDEVANDYRRVKAAELAKTAGKNFEEAAKSASSQARSFEQLCKSQGLKPISLSEFSLSTPSIPEISDRTEMQQVQSVAFNVPDGSISPFVPTGDGGFVIHVKARLPVNETKMRDELPVYLKRMREQRQVAAFQQWLNREFQLHAVFPREKSASEG